MKNNCHCERFRHGGRAKQSRTFRDCFVPLRWTRNDIVVAIISLFFLALAPTSAFALVDAPGKAADDACECEAKCTLEEAMGTKYRGHKYFQSELTLFGGNYLGDEWKNSWDIGGMYALYFNKTYGIGTGYVYTPLRYDSQSSFGQNVTNKNMHIIHGEFYLMNDTAIRAGKSVIECDLFMFVGGGGTYINASWEPTAIVGGGVRLFTPLKWFSTRIDVQNVIHSTPVPGGDTLNADVMFNLGVSVFFNAKEKKKTEDTSTQSAPTTEN